MKTISPYRYAFKLSIPLFFAYFFIGALFSITFHELGRAWYDAPIVSALMFAGAVQFVALSILVDHGTYFALFIPILFLALRNSFYSVSMIERFDTIWYKKLYLAFTLVDANYALLATHRLACPIKDEKFALTLSFLGHFYWVLGSFAGALFSSYLPHLPHISFLLTSLFVTLTLDQFNNTRQKLPLVIAALSAVIALLVWPQQVLLLAIILSIILMSASMFYCNWHRHYYCLDNTYPAFFYR